ncbi:hypothetical protein [Dysosmobacter sp.]|uniref:hypothetical protein n=1 Tax=Dysosmobacter sp. TaxID=2591382 RepID=UPI002A92D235|nr:hypothetical protein [Dysosmobacter sp.]MDY5612547.1 hypothetical protein [Dysosmobacter sp.]
MLPKTEKNAASDMTLAAIWRRWRDLNPRAPCGAYRISNLLHIRAYRSNTWYLLSPKTIEKSRLFGHSPQENLAQKPVPRFLKKAGRKRQKIEDWIDHIFEDHRFSLLSAISRREN